MIAFDSTNLNYTYIFSDNIGFNNYITSEKLNYIFNEYIYYKYEENLGNSIVKYNYGFIDKIENVLIDSNLTNIDKLQLTHWMIMMKYNAVDLFIITSLKKFNDVKLICTYKTDKNTTCVFVDNNIKIDKSQIKSISSIQYDTIDINVIDDYCVLLENKTITTPTTVYYPKKSIDYPDLILIENDYLSNDEFENLKLNNDYIQVNIYSNYLSYKSLYNGFVFKLNFNGYEKYLQLSQENYKVKNYLLKLFDNISNYIPSVIFSYNQYSYIITSANKYPYTSYIYENNQKKYIDYLPNPLIKQNLKFTFNNIEESDLPEYVLSNDKNENQLKLYKTEILNNNEYIVYNNYLYNYVKEYYNSNSDIIINENYELFLEKYNLIKKFENILTKQIEFQDINGDYIDSNIGSIEDSEFIDIQGFDTTTNLPIILYVSKNILYETFYLRQYKVSIGGIIPINNSELNSPYSSNVNDYIVDFIVSDYTNEQHDYNTLHNYIYNLNQDLDNRYLIEKNLSQYSNKYLDFNSINEMNNSFYIYDNIKIYKDIKNILPYKVLLSIIDLDNENDVFIELDKIFKKNDEEIDDDYIINIYLYFNYANFITYKNYYCLTNERNYIDKRLNKRIVTDLYNEIKQNELTSIYEDKNLNKYNFIKSQDIISLDLTNYENNDIKTFLLNDIAYTMYDLDNTANVEYDEVMSFLIGEGLYKFNVNNENKYYLSFYDYNNILNTENKFIIFNKVIGVDQYVYYTLYSDENDLTFSDLFINLLNNFNKLVLLYDSTNNTLINLSVNNLVINTNDNDPIIINKDLIENKIIYEVDKSLYENILNKYKIYNNIYDIDDINIKFSYASYSNKYLFNIKYNDILMVE